MRKYTFLFIIFWCSTAFAMPSLLNMATSGGSGDGSTGEYYYPSGVTASNADSHTLIGWNQQLYVYGGVIQAGQSGVVSTLGVFMYSTPSELGIKLGLYDSDENLLAQCTTSVTTSDNGTWVSCSVDYSSVTASSNYIVMASFEANDVSMNYVDGVDGYGGTCAYVDAMCADLGEAGVDTDKGYSVRMCIGGDCG